MRSKEPLWLPRGSVRAIIALALVVSAIAYVGVGLPTPGWFDPLVALVVGSYFAARNAVNGKE